MINDLSGFPVIIDIPVSWGEMDALKHVNNVVYFRYLETSRISYFENLNYSKSLKDSDVGMILASIDCKFIRPLFYPDTIEVGARIILIQDDRFTIEHAIFSKSQKKIIAVATSLVVTYDYNNNTKINIPDNFRLCVYKLQPELNK